MARIEDRWLRRDRRTRTAEYGRGLRRRVEWTEPGGERRRRSFSSKERAEEWRTRVDHDLRSGVYLSKEAGARPLSDFWPGFEQLKARIDPKSLRNYRICCEKYIALDLGSMPVSEVS